MSPVRQWFNSLVVVPLCTLLLQNYFRFSSYFDAFSCLQFYVCSMHAMVACAPISTGIQTTAAATAISPPDALIVHLMHTAAANTRTHTHEAHMKSRESACVCVCCEITCGKKSQDETENQKTTQIDHIQSWRLTVLHSSCRSYAWFLLSIFTISTCADDTLLMRNHEWPKCKIKFPQIQHISINYCNASTVSVNAFGLHVNISRKM